MNKFIVAYANTYTTEELAYIAEKFDLVIIHDTKAAQVPPMKVINTDLKVIYYKDAIAYFGAQSWVALDAGHRIIHKTYDFPLADISKSDYRTYLANLIATELTTNIMFDGVFLDDVHTMASLDSMVAEGLFVWEDDGVTVATIPTDLHDNWNIYMASMLQEIKDRIKEISSSKLLIINTPSLGTTFPAIADGLMDESFGHDKNTAYGAGAFIADWKARLDAMITNASAGKIVLAQSGVSSVVTTEINQAMRACYALFLMGASPYTYFSFTTSYSAIQWYSDYDMNVGTPLAVYDTISATVLDRKYSASHISINSTTFEGILYIKSDTAIRAVASLVEPAEGVPFNDPIYGTKVTKVIDATTEFSANLAYHGWVRHDTESLDGTMWTVQSTRSPAFHLFNAISPYSKIRDMPVTITNWPDPDFRWPKDRSDFLYVTYERKFAKYYISTENIVDLHNFDLDFPSYSLFRVYGYEGGNPSRDDRYWAWNARLGGPDYIKLALVVYDKDANGLDNGAIHALMYNTNPSYRYPLFIGMSPSGNYVIVDHWSTTNFNNSAVTIYSKTLTLLRTFETGINNNTTHAFPGCGYDDDGNEVLIWVELKAPSLTDYWVVMANIATGEKTYLTYFGTSPNFNASAVMYDKPGWAVISGNYTGGTSWSDGEVFIVQLTKDQNPLVWRFVQSHTQKLGNEHTDDLFAKPNIKGTKIFFRSNWGTSISIGGSDDAYQISLPTDWDKVLIRSRAPTFPYVLNDTTFYPVPDIPKPAKGETITDPVFHTSITRITDSLTEGAGHKHIYPGYSKFDSENSDGTLVLFQTFEWPGWVLYNATNQNLTLGGATYPPFGQIRYIPSTVCDTKDPDLRWHGTDPNILHTTFGKKFGTYNVATGAVTWLYDFTSDVPDPRTSPEGWPGTVQRIFTAEEGNSTYGTGVESRYWFFMANCAAVNPANPAQYSWWTDAILVFDKDYFGQTQGKVISILNRSHPDFHDLNFTSISFDGNWCWSSEPAMTYKRDLSAHYILTNLAGHADRNISMEGKQCILIGGGRTSSSDVWTQMVDFETQTKTWLNAMSGGGGMYHISANNFLKPGWGLVSVYAPSYPTPLSKWDERCIYLVELTTRTDPVPKVWRVCHTHEVYEGYGTSSDAKMNKRGTCIYFGSTWGVPESLGGAFDVYRVDLPPAWYEELGVKYIPPTNGGQDPDYPKILRFGGEENIVIK